MPTFGDKLRHEREARNAGIRDVHERTRIGLRYLEALEKNDFDALPGPRGFGKLYIRAYAEMLGFDPRPLIDAFETEHSERLRTGPDRPAGDPARLKRIRYVPPPRRPATTELTPEAATEHEVTEEAGAAVSREVAVEADAFLETDDAGKTAVAMDTVAALEPESRRRWIIVSALIAAALTVVAVVTRRPTSISQPSDAAMKGAEIAEAQPSTVSSTPSGADEESFEAPIPKSAADPAPVRVEPPTLASVPGRLAVTDYGVGTGVVDRRLVGPGTRFDEGITVFFFTRVVGGAPGRQVRHVWLREGRVIQSIDLPLGSASWRTYSNKTLWGTGNWAVEARGADDRVLASADFNCRAP